MKLVVTMKVEKETKGAVRYMECEPNGEPAFDAKIGTLYIRKSALSRDYPKQITLTVDGPSN